MDVYIYIYSFLYIYILLKILQQSKWHRDDLWAYRTDAGYESPLDPKTKAPEARKDNSSTLSDTRKIRFRFKYNSFEGSFVLGNSNDGSFSATHLFLLPTTGGTHTLRKPEVLQVG